MGKEIIIAICEKLKEKFHSLPNKDLDESNGENFRVSCVEMSEKRERGGRSVRKYRIQIRFHTPEEGYYERGVFVMDELLDLLDLVIIDGQKIPGSNFTATQEGRVMKFYGDYEIILDKNISETEAMKTGIMEDLHVETQI